MDYLDIPLVLEKGTFHRTEIEAALQRYVALFFCSRKYESHPKLDFGLDLDEHSWMSQQEFLRIQVDEFNRVHRRKMSLMVDGIDPQANDAMVRLSLRQGKNTYRLQMSLGSLQGNGA